MADWEWAFLRLGPPVPCAFGIKDGFSQRNWRMEMEMEEAQNHCAHLQFESPFDGQCSPSATGHQSVAQFTPTRAHTKSMHLRIILSQIPVFTSILRASWCFATEKKGNQGLGSKKITDALGVPQSTTNRWLQKLRSGDDMVPRNVGRPRGEEVVLCLLLHFRLTSLELRVICALFSGLQAGL